jgi:hypothetical protein
VLKVHAIQHTNPPGSAYAIRAFCGRIGHHSGMFRAGKWGFESPSGDTIFQAVLPDDTADTTPRVTCTTCLAKMNDAQRTNARRKAT